jgi:hypothetical protein
LAHRTLKNSKETRSSLYFIFFFKRDNIRLIFKQNEELRRKQLEAAERRQIESKTRGISQDSLVEMQLREKRLKEAEKYNPNEPYNLKVK